MDFSMIIPGILLAVPVVLFFLIMLKKHQKSITILTIIVLLSITGVTCMFFFNTPFRDSVNMQLNSSDSHRYTVNNNTYYLPLPPKTALKYRTSDVSAMYITKSTKAEIIRFYRNIFSDDLLIETGNNKEFYLTSEFEGVDIRINIYSYDNSRELFVDIG